MQVQRGVEGFAYVVGGLEQGPGGVGQFADEGGVVLGGGLGGDGFQVGVQRGGLAVQLGVVFADPLAVRGGGAGVVAELGEFADQAFLAGFVAGDPLAELGGLGVAARGGLSRRRRQLSLQHRARSYPNTNWSRKAAIAAVMVSSRTAVRTWPGQRCTSRGLLSRRGHT
ncbi:MAG: hypothetical protein WAK83_03235 [Trebonia sp.]